MAHALPEPVDAPARPHPAPRRLRLALVIANLGWGGAQKVLTTMANHWAALGWEVTLISVDARRVDCYFPPLPQVRLLYLGAAARSEGPARALLHNARRVVLLRRAVRAAGAEVVVSFLSATNVLALLATRGLGIPVIVSERGDPDRALLPLLWRHARTLTYPLADSVVAQTEYALARLGRAVRRRGTVIANPVSPYAVHPDAQGHQLSAVGHLVPVKGFDLLIEAFARASRNHPEWHLVLWGEGPDRGSLLALARRLGVADRVRCPGRSETPGGWIGSTTIFVLSSRHEGLPNALIEAMAAGTPVIATDCPVGGPRSVIAHGLDGLLVPPEDVGTMATALERLMASTPLRSRLGTAAVKSAERFAEPAIMAQWTGLIRAAVAARKSGRRR